jgi:hypothetical protein
MRFNAKALTLKRFTQEKECRFMPNQSYADKMAETNVMLSGLRNNISRLAKRGVTQEFIDEFAAKYQMVQELNSKQEALKAQLKVQTSEYDAEMSDLEAKVSEVRKIVKLEMEPESWRAFGITATR